MAEPLNRENIRTILALTGMPVGQLAVAARTQEGSLKGWLSPEGASLAIDPAVEAAVLRELGLTSNGVPCRKRLHHWRIHESAWRSAAVIYAPLVQALALYGAARMTALLPTEDGMLEHGAVNRFVLRFERFTAVLDVHSSAWRGCRIESVSPFLLAWEAQQPARSLNPWAMARVMAPNCTPRDLDDVMGFPPQMRTPLLTNEVRPPIILPHRADEPSVTPTPTPTPAPAAPAPAPSVDLAEARRIAEALLRMVESSERQQSSS